MQSPLYEGIIRIPSGCAVAGVINKKGAPLTGVVITEMMEMMHERSNGLGGGYAGYGIYPEYEELTVFHLLLVDREVKAQVEELLKAYFHLQKSEEIPTLRQGNYSDAPLTWRYFVEPRPEVCKEKDLSQDELVELAVRRINRLAPKASVMSCGKNMGVFKGVGFPEEIAEFYQIAQYKAYSWIGHGRFPTNTPGWWGGAHPFSFMDVSVVHNGELSSYDANRRFLESKGYEMNLRTDTEVLSYAIHYLKEQDLPWQLVAKVLAPPNWQELERLPKQERELYGALRRVWGSLLMNGPFSIIVGFTGGLMALNDRLKLRALVAAEREDNLYLASEECAIRRVSPEVDSLWYPGAGEAVIGQLEEGVLCHVA